MTPDYFIAKWKAATLTERAGAQSHFLDLCALLDEPTPSESDPTGATYAFEKGVTKTTGGEGWADVWKRGCFAWEYKGKGKDLQAAYAQLQRYAVALENPPLLVVSDIAHIEIHTNWTNTVRRIDRITLDDLADPAVRARLKCVFSDPERLKPGETRQGLTEKAAKNFAELALRLRARGHDPKQVAHFVNRLVFCMFAEDVGLLPAKMFLKMMQQGVKNPALFQDMARSLFGAMRGGGLVGFDQVAWFNGGLFDDAEALPLDKHDLEQTLAAAQLDWAEIDPSILGTLFERGLDPDKRSQLGAHYTDRDKIMLIVDPVIVRPLAAEWDEAKAEAQTLLDKAATAKSTAARTKIRNDAEAVCIRYLERLRNFRVLDPACGSGNFLYLSLLALKDLEHRASLDCEAMGFMRAAPAVGPEALLGIEINPYAAELARVSVWIGEIQWMLRHGYGTSRDPILRPLNTIECRDALLNPDGSEAQWPKADVIVGNPPYVGDRWLIEELGEEYTAKLRTLYKGRLPASANLVCYWFEKSAAAFSGESVNRVGLVATSTIRNPNTRFILQRMNHVSHLYEAWSNIVWMSGHDGGTSKAALRVSVTCFESLPAISTTRLNGQPATGINSDLSARDFDLTRARPIEKNRNVGFQGIIPWGKGFVIAGDTARAMLSLPANPNGRTNSDVLFPYRNASDLTKRSKDRWLINMENHSESAASFYAEPFKEISISVKVQRAKTGNEDAYERWWQLWNPRPALRKALLSIDRYIATPRVSEHRVFVWLPSSVLPDSRLVAVAKDDDTTFGILQSNIHQTWTMAKVALHGVGDDPTYNTQEIFETFPFPPGLEPNVPAMDYANDPRAVAIAEAARRLVEARDRWLNPPELVEIVPEVVPGFPDRILPKDVRAAAILKTRTLTNLYNTRGKPEGAWLDHLHADLDAAVAAAYGWPSDLPDESVLERLLEMNLK